MIIAASMIRRWRVVYHRPTRWLPVVAWRAVHMDTGRTLRGAATSHARAAMLAIHATRQADADDTRAEEARAAARISRLIREEDDRRHGRGVS